MQKFVLPDADGPDPVRSMFDKRAQFRLRPAHRLFRPLAFCQVNPDARNIGLAFQFYPHSTEIVGSGTAIFGQQVGFAVARPALQDFGSDLLSSLLMFVRYIGQYRNLPGPIANQRLGVLVPSHILAALVLQDEDSWQALNYCIGQSLLP